MLLTLLVAAALAGPTEPPVDLHLGGDGILGWIRADEGSADLKRLIEQGHLRKQRKVSFDNAWRTRYAANGLCIELDEVIRTEPTLSLVRITVNTGRAAAECPSGDYTGPMPFDLRFGLSKADVLAKLGEPWTSDTVPYDGVLTATWLTATKASVRLSFTNDALFAVQVDDELDSDIDFDAEIRRGRVIGGVVAPQEPAKPFSLLDSMLEEEERSRSSGQWQPPAANTPVVEPAHVAPADESPFCRALFNVIDDYGSMFDNLRGSPATEAEAGSAAAAATTFHVKSPIPGFESEYVHLARFWSGFNHYNATARSNLSRDEAQRVFDDLRAQILDCTGTPKEPKHEKKFAPMLLAREPLPTVDYMIVGVEDDRSPYARTNFRMMLRVMASGGDTTGTRFDVTLRIANGG